MTDNDVRDVIVIGGGPAGYTAALYSARANLNPLVIEGFNWGGQLMITSDVENYPGYPDGVMGPEMMQEFRRQAERFGAEFVTDDVTKIDFSERPFRVWVGDDGGVVPDALRRQGHDRAPSGRVPRVEDHARTRACQREDRVDYERRRRRGSRRRPRRRRAAARCQHGRHLGDRGGRHLRRDRARPEHGALP